MLEDEYENNGKDYSQGVTWSDMYLNFFGGDAIIILVWSFCLLAKKKMHLSFFSCFSPAFFGEFHCTCF